MRLNCFFETAQRLSAQLSPAVKTNESRLSLQTSSPTPPHPTPPHPIPWCCVAATMCASTRKLMLRSSDHVCKCKERYHPPPHPTPPHPMMLRSSDHVCKYKKGWCCVAATMCASARNVIIPHPTPPHPIPWCCVAGGPCVQVQERWCCVAPTMLCKCKERYHPPPHPTPPHPMMLRSSDHVCKYKKDDVA